MIRRWHPLMAEEGEGAGSSGGEANLAAQEAAAQAAALEAERVAKAKAEEAAAAAEAAKQKVEKAKASLKAERDALKAAQEGELAQLATELKGVTSSLAEERARSRKERLRRHLVKQIRPDVSVELVLAAVGDADPDTDEGKAKIGSVRDANPYLFAPAVETKEQVIARVTAGVPDVEENPKAPSPRLWGNSYRDKVVKDNIGRAERGSR